MIRKGKFNRVSGMGALAAALMMTSLFGTVAYAADPEPSGQEEAAVKGIKPGTANADFGLSAGQTPVTTKFTSAQDGATEKDYYAPSAKDRCSIKYYGVDKYQVDKEKNETEEEASKDVVIKAYRIVEGNYNKYGFLGWTETPEALATGIKLEHFQDTADNTTQVIVTDSNKTSDLWNDGRVITSENITDISRAILTDAAINKGFVDAGEVVELKWDATSNCYKTDTAKPGMYIVLVEKEDRGIIYNPVIVSNDYSNANIAQSLSNITADFGGAVTTGSLHDDNNMLTDKMKTIFDKVYNSGVNADNTAFVAYGSYNPWKAGLEVEGNLIVNSVVTNDNKDKLPSVQENYINSHQVVSYYKDVELNGNVYTQYHGTITNETTPSDKFIETLALKGQAYAKKSSIPVEKNISNASVPKLYTNAPTQGYSKYDDVAEGDTIQYDITTKIPFYAKGVYKDEDKFIFSITDTQHDGLARVKEENIKVYAGVSNETDAQAMATAIVKEANDITSADFVHITLDATGNSFTVKLDKDYCLNNPGMNIVVRYTTTVTEDAALGLNGNKNEVYLEYTTAPTTPTGSPETPEVHRGYKFDFAVAYTFTASAFKLDENGNIVKVDGTNTVLREDESDLAKGQEATKPLAGAKFKLQRVGTHYQVDKNDPTKITKVAQNKNADTGSWEGNLGVAVAKDDKWNTAENEGTKYAENGYRTWYLTSDRYGVLQFTNEDGSPTEFDGIDEGIYTLQEIEAPKDYTINEKIYVIDVDPQFTADGQQFIGTDVRLATEGKNAVLTPVGMKLVDGTNYDYDAEWKLLKEYKFSEWASSQIDNYDDTLANLATDGDKLITTVNFDEDASTGKIADTNMVGIIDTKLTRLPSTGGIGTIVFTVGGFTLMGAAIVLAKKKKEDAE